jgi:phosphocarrier protein FPr/phosphocarrier protein
MMAGTTLRSPLRGWLTTLDEVPDEVFAQRLLGDGVCIDPTNATLHAPCDGEVVSLPASRHAVALRTADGAEILLHIGIDTVALGGAGFESHVGIGDRVATGQRLITFDLDGLGSKVKSLMTPIVITNGDAFELEIEAQDREVAVGDRIGVVRKQRAQAAMIQAQASASRDIVVALAHGIHARPAAMIAAAAKKFDADVQLCFQGRCVNAKSAVAMLSLGIKSGDTVQLSVAGADATRMFAEIGPLMSAEAGHVESPRPIARPTPVVPDGSTDGKIRAVMASRGLGIGRATLLRTYEIAVEEAGRGVAHETAEFERARADVRQRLERVAATAHVTAREVIAAHLEFLDDWELVAAARRSISRGKSAGFAWRRAVRDSADMLRALGDARLMERIDDLLDLESQVLEALYGEHAPAAPLIPERAILLCDDMKPSQFVALDATRVAGICMASGGPTSHVAILAAALGIPMLVAAGTGVLAIEEGRWIILDADNGLLHATPDDAEIATVEQSIIQRHHRKQIERASAHAECRTADGERIEVFANLGSLSEVGAAVANGAEGCGLLRSEFLFLERSSAPDEIEQRNEYQAIAAALGGRPLIIRTLDIGGDKPIPYLPMPPEANPALGLRGIRTSLWRPDLLRTQLRAILSVQPAEQCRVLLPMITDIGELRAIRRIIAELCRELQRAANVQLGVMIETPAAAVSAEQLAKECDFLSIGTNDLTQYTLAMDRTHSELAHRIDALHPAVLRLIELVTIGAQRHERLVAVCGGLASDPQAVAILVGLGVRELSVVPASIPQIKALVRGLTLESAAALAQAALQLESAEAVRALVHQHAQHVAQVMS